MFVVRVRKTDFPGAGESGAPHPGAPKAGQPLAPGLPGWSLLPACPRGPLPLFRRPFGADGQGLPSRGKPGRDGALPPSRCEAAVLLRPSAQEVAWVFTRPRRPVSIAEAGGLEPGAKAAGKPSQGARLKAGNRLGPPVAGAPDLGARGGSKPPWRNSPKRGKQVRPPTIPIQGGR